MDVRVTRLALVHAIPRITYPNGDQVDYLDLVFRCEWVSGEPHPADGELTEVVVARARGARRHHDSDHVREHRARTRRGRPGAVRRRSPALSAQRRSRRITTRGMRPDTESVSAAFVKPAFSNIARVPT